MDKDDIYTHTHIYTMEYIYSGMAHIYNGILLSCKKKQKLVICSDVDWPRDCHTEWSKSEREKQIPYANTYICNQKKMVLKNLGAGQE